jgi:hypothetical protein
MTATDKYINSYADFGLKKLFDTEANKKEQDGTGNRNFQLQNVHFVSILKKQHKYITFKPC